MKNIQREKKNRVLNIRLSDKDLERLEKLSAKYGGLSYAAIIRMLLHQAIDTPLALAMGSVNNV